MQLSQQSRLDALHRIQSFMDQNADAVGNVNKSASRLALDQVLTELEKRATAQGAAAVQAASGTQAKNELREDLRLHHMQPITAIARATLAHTPLIAKLRLPSSKVSDSTLISAGNAMADVAAQYEKVFTDEQLPADFVAQLRTSVKAVRKTAVARDGFQNVLTQSTQAVNDELVRAKNVVKVLNSLVVKQLKGKGDLLAGWRQAKHAKLKPGVPQGSASAATTPVSGPAPAAPTPAPTVRSSASVPTASTAPAEVPAPKAA